MEKKREATTLSVHRCRFVDYTPSAITALAFPPLALPSAKGKKMTKAGKQPLRYATLATGRANGNINLCEWIEKENEMQSSQAWVVRKTLSGPHPSKVDSLAFVIRYPDEFGPNDVPTCNDLRLFSSGGGSELLEWDLDRSCIRQTISSQGGSIWCITANPSCTHLAIGCEDGAIRLLSVENDTLTHTRRFDRVKCRMLSIAWGPPVPRQTKPATSQKLKAPTTDDEISDDDEDEWEDSWLVSGDSDSSLRKWNVKTGRMIERMCTDKIRGERTLVWTVGVLGDGTVVSGDSLGMIKFWDSRTCTQLQSFPAHGADVLCLTISPEGKAVYTSGVDQRTVQFSLVKTSNPHPGAHTAAATRWVQTSSRRMHTHDVRALAIWPPYTPLPASFARLFPIDIAPVLASGGLDMSVVVTPAALPTSTIVKIVNPLNTSTEATFEDAYHRRLAYPVSGAVKVARGARLVVCTRDAGISIWRIMEKPTQEGGGTKVGVDEMDMDKNDDNGLEDEELREPFAGGWDKVLEMDLNVTTNIIASEISDDGRWLVVSDLYETKLFSLRKDSKQHLTLKRIREFPALLLAHIPDSPHHSTGGLAFAFTPDSAKLVMSTALSAYILILDLASDVPRVLRRFSHHRIRDSGGRTLKGRPARIVVDDAEMTPVEEEGEDDQNGESQDEEEGQSSPDHLATVNHLAISPDGQWLATSDSHSRTHIFNLDSISHHTTLPTSGLPAQTLGFPPTRPNALIIAFADNSIQVFDVEARTFPAWGRALSTSLPRRITGAHDPVLGLVFDSAEKAAGVGSQKGGHALFWGATWLFRVSLSTSVARAGWGRKRRREQHSAVQDEERTWRDWRMITQYRPVLGVGYVGAGELVVVERPLVDVLALLPPAYFKHRYGS